MEISLAYQPRQLDGNTGHQRALVIPARHTPEAPGAARAPPRSIQSSTSWLRRALAPPFRELGEFSHDFFVTESPTRLEIRLPSAKASEQLALLHDRVVFTPRADQHTLSLARSHQILRLSVRYFFHDSIKLFSEVSGRNCLGYHRYSASAQVASDVRFNVRSMSAEIKPLVPTKTRYRIKEAH
jgi:hypothetical protein